ncbi:ras-related protein Rab-17 isoform X2 [Dendropsophus ebraccatus]|uniref:ras-related protein Rab-17 isoform X2 n=1 Tax=Dendropsophus ebraccatus TaxID=150705 RepID=UPI003831DF96
MALMESCESLTDDVFKLVLLGSSEVGKSSLVIRYVRDVFRETLSTTGCAFFSHRAYVQGRSINLEIWDTAGQERFQSLCHIYYRGANAALLVYDITSKETLSRAQFWLQELQKYALNGDMVIALVGNKSDLQDYRTVPSEDAQAFAKMNQLLFMETSAKTGNGVKEIFDKPVNS